MAVADLIGQLPGFAQIERDTFSISQRLQHVTDIEADVDRLLSRIKALRQLRQGFEGPLEQDHGLRVGLPVRRLRARLAQVSDRLVEKLAAKRMIRQPFDLFVDPSGIPGFYRMHDALMYFAPPFIAQTSIRDIVG